MKNHFNPGIITITLVVVFVLSSCRKNEEPLPVDPVPISLTAEQVGLITSGNSFAIDMFKKVTEKAGEGENLVISPFSISVALSMAVNGANGQTREAMLQALRSAGISPQVINESYEKLVDALLSVDSRVIINIANSVWTEKTFAAKKQFTDILVNYYNAESQSFDINDQGAPAKVNKWIEDKTNGLIREMISSLDPNTVMLLINAIYFKGQWNSQFEKSKTVNENFLAPSSAIPVPMMKQTHEFKIFKGSNFVFAEFPYGQGNYVMDVVLPDEQNGINNIIRNMTVESFNNMTENLHSQEINLTFPRFKYGYKKQLNEILSDMGMGIAFIPGSADFSNISDRELYINKVLHQAFVETNEEGTEAAAATVVEIGLTMAPAPPMVLKLDHPFMYVIRETSTNSIIFMGRVSDPSVR
ncbi:MAG TPA: serpin family protein [Bacteroidales bacterium]|jgi:serpin B|nr:serpin family protein [Bacteroidales bacterium]